MTLEWSILGEGIIDGGLYLQYPTALGLPIGNPQAIHKWAS
jgi:hypothetical protein